MASVQEHLPHTVTLHRHLGLVEAEWRGPDEADLHVQVHN